MDNSKISELEQRIHELESLVLGLVAYVGVQAKRNGWDGIDFRSSTLAKIAEKYAWNENFPSGRLGTDLPFPFERADRMITDIQDSY